MPTVAPIPADVVQLRATFRVGEREPSCAWWLWNPGLPPLDLSQLEDVLSAFLLNCLPPLSGVMHVAVSLSDITAHQAGVVATSGFDFFAGTWSGAQQLGTTVGWHWIDGRGRASSSAITHLPGTPDAFVEDDGGLSHTGYTNLRDQGAHFLNEISSLPNGTGGSLVPVVLHRRSKAGPLPAAIPTPIAGVQPMMRVSTLNRRIRKPRGIGRA